MPGLLYLLVAISGGSALVYEVVWIRALGLHFGTSTPAIATVVAAFMAGLGAGNALLGALADRSPRPLALYWRVELGIALSALAVSLVALRAGGALDALSRWCASTGAWSLPLRALVLAAMMLVPCTLIGGTLPLLARVLFRRGQGGRALGTLYALNTCGAIGGALLPDFALIPHFGLTVTACSAAVGNALIAAAAAVLARAPAAQQLPAASDAPAPAAGADRRGAATALLLSMATGFTGMGLEVLWSRTLAHWAAALATSFAVLLAVYLVAIAAGAALTRVRADRSPAPLRTASLLCALAGAAALLPIVLAPAWRTFERGLWPRPPELRRLGLLHEAVDALLHATFLEAAACALMGAAFPYVAAAWLRDGKPGTRTGLLFTANTLAGVLGAILVGFVWLPAMGELSSYCAAALMLAAFGVVGMLMAAPRARVHAALAAFCAFAVLIAGLRLPGDHLARAHFRSGGRVLALREGSTTTAAAAQRFAFGEPAYMELLTPGVSMSETSQGARHYMGMMAHAALLAARKPERALLICYGVGNTASALLSHTSLRRLDVVDISEEVLALASWFGRARGDDPLEDPRTRVFVDDGRHHLITHDERYDVITAEPPPPNHAGVVNLYSRELYRLARQRLAPGGVITQWLPVFQLSDDDTRAMVAAFAAELPHVALIYGYDKHFVLIGSREPFAADPMQAGFRAADPRVRRNLRDSGIGDAADVLGSVLQTDAELRRWVRGVEPLSDDRPVIQYPWQALGAYPDYAALFGKNPARATALLAPGATTSSVAPLQSAQRALAEIETILSLTGTLSGERADARLGPAIRRALAARPDHEGALMLLGLGSERARLANRALTRPGATALLRSPAAATRAGPNGARRAVLLDAARMLERRASYLSAAGGANTRTANSRSISSVASSEP